VNWTTIKLYWKDAYLKEFESIVEKAEGNTIVLKETLFYPTSGGAPNDTGKMTIKGKEYQVVDVTKEGDEIIHVLDEMSDAAPGDAVQGRIDWERRYAVMRYHTALHLLDAVVEKNYSSGKITGGQIFVDRARMDLDMPELNKEVALKIIEQANAIALEGHGVSAREISREEALKIPNLARTEPGRQMIMGMSSIRLVEIEGLDFQMDGGTHVQNTNEIGKMSLNAYENKGAHRKRVDISLQ
jgi:misacylated tRNA(Ala) deacylase